MILSMFPLIVAVLLGPPSPPPDRIAAKAFGRDVQIEARDFANDAGRAILEKAVAEIAEMERLMDAARPEGGLAVLNAAAGKGPQAMDPRLFAVLARARDFCIWSEGAHGPLDRDLYALFGLRAPAPDPPPEERLHQALSRTGCEGLALDPEKGTATLAEGYALDLWGFAEGHAVDRAVEILRQGGIANGFVRIGQVQRGFGPGPGGRGWRVVLPPVPGLEEPAGRVDLRDRALAIASPADHPRQGKVPYVNQRTGLPAQGVLALAAVSDLALDAQGLATILFIIGPKEGQLRMGSVRPRPSILWLLGSGEGPPLQVDYRWSEISRR